MRVEDTGRVWSLVNTLESLQDYRKGLSSSIKPLVYVQIDGLGGSDYNRDDMKRLIDNKITLVENTIKELGVRL